MTDKDIIIIGGGAAGLSAGIFASRLGLNTLLLERLMPGGQVINAEVIEDYPGFEDPISGAELVGKMQEQAMAVGTEIRLCEVTGISRINNYWSVETYDGAVSSHCVIIAGGSTLRKLGVKGETKLEGAGVSYCATCDGAFFIGQQVCVIGGGDSALTEALVLTEFASRIDLYCRENTLHGQQILQDRVTENDKITIHFNVEITEIHGDGMVESVSIRDIKSGETTRTDHQGVFIFTGLDPNTDYLSGLLNLDNGGHIETDVTMRTHVSGILAAGDIRKDAASQLITSAGDGSTAALSAFRYIKTGDWGVFTQS